MRALLNSQFRRFWVGQTISSTGSAISTIALPLVAVTALGAGPKEMGWIVSLQNLPILLFGLLMGVWVDRVRRQLLFVAATILQGLILATIPMAAMMGWLRIEWLYVTSVLAGFVSPLATIAGSSMLPNLVPRERLVEANTRLQVADRFVSVSGRAVGGFLVDLLTAPIAVLVDAISFIASALVVSTIQVEEVSHKKIAGGGLFAEALEGLRAIVGHPHLRALVIGTCIGSFAASLMNTVLVLYATEELHLSATWIGVTFSVSSLVALLGSAFASRLSRWIGPGPALAAAMFIEFGGIAILPFLSVELGRLLIPLLIVSQGLVALGVAIYSILQISIRQAVTPDRLLGRVNATRRVAVFGVIPLGGLAAGYVGEVHGLVAVMALSTVGILICGIYFALSSLGSLRVLPVTVNQDLTP